jgi:hypothetical protein
MPSKILPGPEGLPESETWFGLLSTERKSEILGALTLTTMAITTNAALDREAAEIVDSALIDLARAANSVRVDEDFVRRATTAELNAMIVTQE